MASPNEIQRPSLLMRVYNTTVALASDINTTKQQTENTRAEVETLKQTINGLSNTAVTGGDDLVPLVTQIASVEQTANSNKEKVTLLAADAQQLQAEVTNATSLISALEDKLSKQDAATIISASHSKLCSSVLATFAPTNSTSGGTYNGSGSFITLTDNDLPYGLFLTCAHMVIEEAGEETNLAEHVYIENPLTNEWIRVTPDSIFIDGAGDIALIKTNVDFTQSAVKPLKLAAAESSTGDDCFIVGDPMGMDSDSISKGIIRSWNYTMKPTVYQINECLHVDASTASGNSGSPILNRDGDIIGMLTYGITGTTTFGGGPNLVSLRCSLSVLSQLRHNKEKKFIGASWGVVYPMTLFDLKSQNPNLPATTRGITLQEIDPLSPLAGILNAGDILINVQLFDANDESQGTIVFGVHDDESSLAVLLYKYTTVKLIFEYISGQTGQSLEATVPFTKTYADVPDVKDIYLKTGLSKPLAVN